MALYDAENRKKKKDQVQRQTDTGTGRAQGQAKPGIVKPGAKRVSTPSPAPTPKPTTTTATVAKPGVTKGKTAAVPANTTTRQTDTGTGRKGTVRLETPKQTKEEKQAESRRRQRITEERQQAEASKKRLENNQKLMGEGKTSRYQQYVLGEKTRQYAQDLDEQSLATAIKQRQRDDALRNWNLDAAKKEREQISQDADKAKIALRSLTPQINYYEARGDHATADMLRQQQVALQQQVNKLAEFDRDYEQARSLQYDEAGGKVLDKLRETDSGAWNLINSLAQRTGYTSKDTGDTPVAPQQNGTFDIDPGTIEARTAKDDETRALLKKMGYADKDIEQMLNYRIRQINREIYEDTVKQAKEFAQRNAAGASAVSVGTNIGAGLGFVDSAVQKLRNPDRPIDFYSDSNLPSAYTNAIREQVSQDLIDKYGEKGKVYSFLYQSGMSMADSGVNMMLGAAGMPEALGLAVMAGSAATSSMKEAHDRGLSDSQALKIGLISGIAEYGTEKIGLDAFLNTVFKRTKGSHAAARALLTNVFAEGGEEVASDVINLAADLLISQDKSEWEQKIQQYRDLGFTDSEAFSKVLAEQIKDTGLSFLGGALSGGVMGGGGLALNHVIDNHTEELLYAGYAAGDGTEAKSAAQNLMDLQRKLSVKETAGEKLTEDDQRAYTAAVDQLKSAMDSMDSETRRDLMQVGRETRKEMARDAKAAKKAAKQVSRMVKETAQNQRQTETTETVEAVENGSTEAVEQEEQEKPNDSTPTAVSGEKSGPVRNKTAQQALELVKQGGDLNQAKAVNMVYQSTKAQKALGLSFDKTATVTERRTRIRAELESRAGVALENSAQVSSETAAISAQAEDEAAFQRFSKLYDRVNGEGTTEEEKRAAFQEYGDSFVADGELWTKPRFAEELRRRDPNVTEAEIETRFQQVKAMSDESLARKEKTEYTDHKGQAVKEENHGEKAEKGPVEGEAAGAAGAGAEAETGSGAASRARQVSDGSRGLDGRSNVGGRDHREENSPGERGDVAEAAERGTGHRSDVSRGTRTAKGSSEKVRRPLPRDGTAGGSGLSVDDRTRRGSRDQSGVGGENRNSERVGGGKSGRHRGLNHDEAERIRGLNLKTSDVKLPGSQIPMQVVDDVAVPEEYRPLFDEARRMGLALKCILGYFTDEDGERVPAFIDRDNGVAYVSIDNESYTARTLFDHEAGHHLLYVTPKLWGDVLQAAEDAGVDYALMRAFAEEHYRNYEKKFGPLTDYNADDFIEEMLCDVMANRRKNNFPPVVFAKMRKAILPHFEQAVAAIEQRQPGQTQPSGKGGNRYFNLDFDNLVPPWEQDGADEGGYDDVYEDIYEDVLPEDRHPDVVVSSIEETGDKEENDNYYTDPGKDDDAPSGLGPEDVIYDPDQLAYYDKASGRLVVYDETSQTFFYDEFSDVFGDEEPGALPENQQEREVTQNAPAPGYVSRETAVGDVQPTATNTEAFKGWFNDPTKGRELSAGKRGKKPKTLFHGSVSAGFTKFLLSMGGSTASGGIYLTDDIHTADLYARDGRGGEPREFKPIVAQSWEEAQHFTRKDLGMRLEQNDNGYTLYMYNEKTKLYDEKGTFSPDEAGLQSFNDTYGTAHRGVKTQGVYRLYGTAQNALVLDAHGRNWQYVLYDPVGREVDQNSGPHAGRWWSTDDIVDRAFASGYDCVIIKNVMEGVSALSNDYIFKDPGQVKSIYNTGTWDRNNPDLRYFDEDDDENDYALGGYTIDAKYNAETGEITLEGMTYATVDEFKNDLPDLYEDYEPDEIASIINALAADGLNVDDVFTADLASPTVRRGSEQFDELVSTLAHEARTSRQAKPGFSEDYGTGRGRGLLADQVIYDPAYDSEEHPTPFFERSTGKPVWYDKSSGVFRYDEVRELLGAENPALIEALETKAHFPDFDRDQYLDKPKPISGITTSQRRELTQSEKDDLIRTNQRKRGIGSYSAALFSWFNDPTETKELTGAGGFPLQLFRGTTMAGYTSESAGRLRRRGRFTTQLRSTAAVYGGEHEFVPRHLETWDGAARFINDELGMDLWMNKDTGAYELSSVNPDTGELDLRRSYPATEAGLAELNQTYGEVYTEAALTYGAAYPGVYRVYGTSDKAFVLDLGDGDDWNKLLYNPTGLVANPRAHWVGHTSAYWDTDDLADFLFSQGYDCVIVKNVDDANWERGNNDYIFRDPGQLKSVYNVGTFDRSNSDLRYFDEDDNEIAPPELSYEEQLDMALRGALNNQLTPVAEVNGKQRSSAVYVSFETPEILAEINMKDLPILVTQKHLRDANHQRVENSHGEPLPGYEHYHGITKGKLKKLPELLQKPAMLIRATGSHAGDVVVVTTEKDYRGRQIIVTIRPSGTAAYDGVEGPANFITSVYGYGKHPSAIRGLIEIASKQGRVLYAHKNRSQEIMSREGGQQLPAATAASAKDGFNLPSPTPNQGSKHTPGASTHNNRAFDSLSFDTIIGTLPEPVNPSQLKRRFFDEDEDSGKREPDTFESLLARAEAAYNNAKEQAQKNPVSATSAGSIAQSDETMLAWIIARRRYGDIPQTGSNFREVQVPARTKPDNKVSKTVSTVMGAEATPEKRLLQITDAVVGGKLSYVPVTDKIAENKARAKIKKDSFQKARIDWAKAISEGKVNKDLVAMGATLLNNAGNSDTSGEEYIDILTDYTDLLRRAGQALQAAKLLKKLSPEAKLYAAQRQVDKINEDLAKRGLDPTKYPGVTIDPALIDAYRNAKTDAERDEVMDLIAQNIADQIPPSAMDKFTAWRYLAMLGNFRTQVRNVLGNTMVQPMRMLKSDVAGLAEALIQRMGGKIDRTTSVLRDGETFKAAFQEFSEVREMILGGGKYDDSKRFTREIEEKRRIFKFKPLEAYRRATNWAMDQGDAVFCSFTYADALARYIKANGTTWSQASEELKEKARTFAIREAAEATYRDNNAFSDFIVSLRVRNPDNAVKKAASAVIEGVLPFRKTPANILVRTVEYSPVGLVHGAYSTAVKAVGKSNVTGAEIVNQLAKGLTGSGLLALGLMLAAKGLLVGKAPDDDKEKEMWKREGHQAYALEIGGVSYTLDWMAPTCVPLFLGANLHEALLADGLTLQTALDSLRTISDPVLEMSMLQGIQNLIDNAANYGDESALVRLTGDALWSYVSQVVPTIVGQGERAFETTRMQTYTDKNNSMPTDWQYDLGKMSAKIPGWDYAQIVYTDAWGRTQDYDDSLTLRILQQMCSPGFVSHIKTSDMEKELNRLYKATGDKGVLIASADRKIEYTWEDANGEKHNEKKNLTGAEYLTYNTTRGQTAYQMMTDLTRSSFYENKSDDVKADLVQKVYEYATACAKKRVASDFELPSWVEKAQTAEKDLGMSEVEFINAYVIYGSNFFSNDASYDKLKRAVGVGVSIGDYVAMKTGIEKNEKGNIDQEHAKAYLDRTNFSREQKALLWNLINSGWKNNPYS